MYQILESLKAKEMWAKQEEYQEVEGNQLIEV